MKTHAEKTQENKSQSVSNSEAQIQSSSESTFQFVDNRPEAAAQRKLQEMVAASPQAKQTVQLLAMSVKNSIEQQQPIQKKENNTGLPDNLKTEMENLSGYSMDDVKVHYNSDKPAQLQAHAYAQGTDIHLATGQEKHLPHEAWHVVQQMQGRVKPTMQMKGEVNDDAILEKEADVMGAKALNVNGINTKVNITSISSSAIKQAKFHRSNKKKRPIPDKTLNLIEAILKSEDDKAYLAFIKIRQQKRSMSFFLFMEQNNIKEYARLVDVINGKGGNDLTEKERNPPRKGLFGTLATPVTWLISKFGPSGPDKFKLTDRTAFRRNNCLIHAIANAAGIQVTDDQIVQMRTRINQPVGEMLFSTNSAIQIILNVLGINNQINITYANLIGTGFETEQFNVGNPPLNIQHDGVNHFYFDRNQKGKKGGSLDFHLAKNMKLLDSSGPMNEVIKSIIKNFNREVVGKIDDNEKRLLMWLQNSLSASQFEQMCRGGQIRINYSDSLFKKLVSMNAERRKSSHYKGIIIPTAFSQVANEHYGIDGHFFPTILFGQITGKNGKYIYLQPERNSYNPSAKLKEKIHHVFDAAKYASEWTNQGPYGESEHTDSNPMGVTENPQPGLLAKLSLARLQSVPLILLHQIRGIPGAITRNWRTIVLVSLIAMFNIMRLRGMGDEGSKK